MDFFNSFLLLLAFICVESSVRPQIRLQDGHLFITPSRGRNISLETSGKGTVSLNGVDLSEAVKMVLKASHILERYTTNFEDSFTKIDEFDKTLRGKSQGIIPRLEKLEIEVHSLTNVTTSPVSNSKLSRLTRQLQSAMADLASLTKLLNRDECKSNPCSNGGTCQDLFNNFICQCPDAWEGPRCDIDVNECSRFVGTDLGCQNGATCINKPGTYQCMCTKGWYGIHCTRRSKSCDTASSSSLCGHGICVPQNTDLGYKCICDQGYTNSATSQECVDVDECKSGKAVCSVNPLVSCINTPGSFRCGNCPEGFSGNGFYCTDINECLNEQNGCSKSPLVECINTMGSYRCGACPPGYIGDGRSCTYKGICNVNNGGCHPLASCIDTKSNAISLVQCVCPPGYKGNGMGPNGCIAPSTPWSPCTPNPCQNGTCIVGANSTYTCNCYPPFFGKNCQFSLSPCSNNPCKNGGTCYPRGFLYRCSCSGSWTGSTCAVERNACGGVISQSSGTLKYPPTNFYLRPEIRSCAWIIETAKNQILTIQFREFHMKYTKECNKDWVQMHDGRNTASHTLGRYCGNNLPKNGTFSTTHNSIYIWFRTDGSSSDSGFALNWNSTTPKCTSNITAISHGSLHSPGSPGIYPNNRDCFWLINAPSGKRLRFDFFSFDVGNSVNCSGDYLEIFSTSSQKETPFAKFCNSTTLPSPLHTPGSVALLHFHSDEMNQHPGFQISYSVVEGIPGCGGTFTSSRGELSSPSYKGRYLADLDCEYKIKLAPGLRVKLEFVSFELEAEGGCKFDFLEIFEGPNSDSPLVGRYCGENLPGPYLSNGNEVTLHFKSDWATGFKGFVLRYDTVCGRKFTERTGIIQSDGYPSHYANGVSCLYEIIQPPGYIITLTFTDFNLENPSTVDDCYDYLEVRDGDYENSTLIGKFCNDTAPKEIISTFNYLWMKFISDDSVSDRGFRANYSVTDIGCGGLLKESTGIISPQFNLGSRTSCNWIIQAPVGSLIRLMWVTFQLKQRYICDREYIQVFDNNTITGRGGLVGKFCGNKLPPSFISTSNVVTLSLVLEKSNSITSGFTLSYNFVKESKLCGGDFHSPGGIIRSPNYPSEISPNIDCTWTITVQQNHQIMLNFTSFHLENIDQCKYDALEIRNGKSASSPLVGRFCGSTIPQMITSHANQMYIHFKTDNHGYGGKFELQWESAATGCGGILSALSGSIVSPMYPEPYNKFTDCYWKISVSAGSLVQIIFTDIDLEAHSFCLLDYVEVFDGSSAAAKSLGRFCSLTHPTFIRTTQNHAFVRFKSDVSYQGRGFQLQYTTLCQNNLTGFYGVIESPNFPNRYQLSEDCVWNIAVEAKNKINVTFTTFDVRSWNDYGNKTCTTNSVEIKYELDSGNPDTPTYDTFGKYCGQMETPKLLTLDHDRIQITYSAKTRMIGTGFRLEWALDGCGGKVYYAGTIQSPNYPKGYPESSACRWELETEFGSSLVLTFDEIDLERTSDCIYDSIQVYNGPDKSYPALAHFCHQDKPIKITSNGNKMSVYFTTDSSYQGKGFSASFTSIKSKCGGRLTLAQGSIFSPNYPNNFNRNDSCEWLLEVDENHLIDLEFEDVELPKSSIYCEKNFVKVYDGPSAAYPVLAKLCGNQKPNKTITSSHNTLFVQFFSYTFLTAKGFRATFHKACGARIVASVSGEIQMHPEFVDNDRISNCTWTIIAPNPNEHIALTITHMGVRYVECGTGTSTVTVYDGENENGTVLGSFCGRTTPGMILSKGNALHIVTETYVFLNADYEVYDSTCGGSINTLSGIITSPGFLAGTLKSSETECEWYLNIAPGNFISLTFGDFKLPLSDKCNTDFLEVRRFNSTGELLGNFCGDTKPADLSVEGTLWLYLRISDAGVATSTIGFKASFAIGTNNVLNKPSGQIANPLYPKPFSTYEDYTWRISVTFGKKIVIKFKEISLGTHYESDCSGTGMKIYDGIDSTAPLLKELCDYNLPEPVKTTSNEAFITVSLTAGMSKFLIEWEESESYYSPQAKNETVEGCGSADVIDMTSLKNYTLKSPGYPDGYANQLKCDWKFATSQSNHLDITMNWVDLKSTYGSFSTCTYMDSVEIFSGKETTDEWKSIKKICTVNETHSVYSTSNLMKVTFFTDYNGNGTGFSADIKEACGGEIFKSEGTIIFDNEHPRSRLCEWNVTVPSGKTIGINFEKFNIDPGQKEGCRNYLMLRNGLEPDAPLLGTGKLCGTVGEPLKTTGNRLRVKYSGSPNVKGFVLHFTAISYGCGGYTELNLYEKTTNFSSPNYPNVPPSHIDCVWVVRSPPGTSIQLDFHGRFDLTRSVGCVYESVEIRDGATQYSPLIGKFCTTMPSTQFSTDNMMFVKFVTDVNDPKNGFKATARIATCGGTYRGTKGVISWSADDSRLQQSKNNCTWRIIAPEDYNLVLKIEALDVPLTSYSCGGNIYSVDPVSRKEVFVKKICSRFDTQDIVLNSNEAVIYYKHISVSYAFKKFVLAYNATKQNCSFTLNNPSGRIQSPGYPNLAYHVIHCKWTIKVQKGKRITITFVDIDLDEHLDYQNQGIVLLDDDSSRGFLAYARLINGTATETRRQFKSSSNLLALHYWSVNAHGRGFYAVYRSDEETVCKGSFNDTSGTFSVPNATSFVCSWERKQSNWNSTLKVTATMYSKFKKPVSGRCGGSNAAILIYNPKFPLNVIFSLCRNTTSPVVFRTSFPSITLYTWGKMDRFNYTLSYDTYPCGGLRNEPTGTISTPNFPNKPSSSFECSWLVTMPKEQQVNVSIYSLDLDGDCDKNFVEIFNGRSPKSPRIAKFCKDNMPKVGTSKPFVVISERNYLTIDYHYEAGSDGKGFNLTYEPIINGCGGIYHDNNHIIQTPGYPKNYPNNSECVWEVRAPEGYHVGLTFVQRFHLEDSENCQKDFLKIWEWKNEGWSLLNTLCGREVPKSVNSTGTRMKIMFRSDDNIQTQGFKAKWEFNCGGTFKATDVLQYIVSPGYPVKYPNRIQCVYKILPPNTDQYINLKFLDFELEYGMPACVSDNVTIKSLSSYYDRSARTLYCENSLPPANFYKDGVKITFTTDSWIVRRGFKFSFSSTGCGGNVTSPMQISTDSSLLGSSNTGYVDCEWNIIAPPKKIIAVRFLHFVTPHTASCSYDSVLIFNGLKRNTDMKLASLCGNLTANPPTINSPNNTLTIAMSLNPYDKNIKIVADIFFTAGPSEGCGGTFNVTSSKVIRSPNINEVVDCYWKFLAPVDYTLEFEIANLDMPDCKKGQCSCSFLEVRDGGSSLSTLIDTLCNSTSTVTKYRTSTRYGFLRLYMDGSHTPFSRITVKPILSPCGKSILNVTNQAQNLTSPNYPNSYPENIRCRWLLTTSNYKKMVLHFRVFDLSDEIHESGKSVECLNDYLEIEHGDQHSAYGEGLGPTTVFGGRGKSSKLFDYGLMGVHTFCGRNDHIFDYYPPTGTLAVILASKSGTKKGKGFVIQYQLTGCNRNYTEDFGRIGFSLSEKEDCLIGINVKTNNTISLYFSEFYSFNSDNCSDEYLQVLDGDLKTGKEIRKLCGYGVANPIFSSTNQIWLRIHSEKNSLDLRADITYITTDKGRGCGGTVMDIAGTITSPMYPNAFRNNTQCVWYIAGPPESKVKLTINVFDIQASCDANYLKITTYDNGVENNHEFCKGDDPAALTSDSKLIILYQAAIHNGGTGWTASFTAIDDGDSPPSRPLLID